MKSEKLVNGLVSIIMPSWNTAKFIGETIQSVKNQTYTNWELLIVDDCSTDNTDEIVASFKDDRIRYFHNEKNSGAALTRNKALREAKGEWIAFLDSDDLWAPTKLEHQINFMKKNGYNLSFTEYEKIDEEYEDLIKFFRNQSVKDPTDLAAVSFRVQCYIDVKDFDNAEKLCSLLSDELKNPLLEEINKAKTGGTE